MTDGVPYQAYRSKRQLQLQSSQGLSEGLSSQGLSHQSLTQSQSSQSQSLTQSLTLSPSQSQTQTPSQPPLQRHSTFRRIPRRPPPPPSHSRNLSLDTPPSARLTFPAPPPTPPLAPPLVPPTTTPTSSASSTRPPSTNTSQASQPIQAPQRPQAPYRPGFQPKGLYRPLTDQFLALRRAKRDGDGADGRPLGTKRVERTKMLRRLDKLIHLHFPSHPDSAPARHVRPSPASSLFDLDLRNITIADAAHLLRGVVGAPDDLRAAEQRITPWQDDAHVKKCPLCSTSFHPLTNRKHHCRLCGQIICSLPVKHPHRPVTCSLLFVVDPNTRRIEQVDERVDYGVTRKSLDTPHKPTDETFLKAVRICRSCRPILLRQQYQYDFTHVPLFTKLYNALIALEQQIQVSLPQFQQLVLSLTSDDPSQPHRPLAASRKRLLEAFAQYDALAKRIRALPCPPASSADQVQSSIMNRASSFLQKNMVSLHSLPKPKPNTTDTTSIDVAPNVDPDSQMAMALQPLLEQEALLESFVQEAKAHRKFEDLKTLKNSLCEIRTEIDRIATLA